jgi:glycosyltransferase involved in cell wall biosynthesis
MLALSQRGKAGEMLSELSATREYESRQTAAASVVVVDWNVTSRSPIGSSLVALLGSFDEGFRYTVVAGYFENPRPGTIEHIRVWLPRGPSFVKELCWPTLVRLKFMRDDRLRGGGFVVRATQGQLPGSDIAAAHFCHRAYLERFFRSSGTRGLRRMSRYLVHRYSASLERKAFQRARFVTVCSAGLYREIAEFYPFARGKLVLIPNPLDVAWFAPEPSFDRAQMRADLGFKVNDVVFCLVALGDFARKGLAVVIGALASTEVASAKILVVGGTRSEIDLYRKAADAAGVGGQITFAGFQSDVRPYLWISDVFLFPTLYEAAPKAVDQAAAAGLPVIATRVNGVEDFVQHGWNGWFVERDEAALAAALNTAIENRGALAAMGRRARESVGAQDRSTCAARWQELFARVAESRVANTTEDPVRASAASSPLSDRSSA